MYCTAQARLSHGLRHLRIVSGWRGTGGMGWHCFLGGYGLGYGNGVKVLGGDQFQHDISHTEDYSTPRRARFRKRNVQC